jgi:hippurate hydrolase
MPIKDAARPYLPELVAIRRDIHAHPELGYEEKRTADVVARTLAEYGVDEVHTGIAITGVVGVVRGRGASNRAIGLRADMDALPIAEQNGFGHASTNPGKMHACGHDGHTAMLLGAARYLADTRDFAGTVYLIFQPAEEGGGGGRRMMEEGLFKRFPVEQVFGMHNIPGIPLGQMGMRTGPCMAAVDTMTIRVRGVGSHAAMPHHARDPVLAASHLVTALQSIVARRVDPLDSAVVSVTRVHGGDAFNVIPELATVDGTVRTFKAETRDLAEAEVRRIAKNIAAAFDLAAEVSYSRGYPVTVNTAEEVDLAAAVAGRVLGEDKVMVGLPPIMAAEDFSYMLNERPGAFVWLGNGALGEAGGRMVHTPTYDFNDEAIIYGVSYWAELVETALPRV